MANDEVIRLSDKGLSMEMHAIEEMVAACYQCGTCTGSCPVAWAMDYSPRQIIRMIQVGLEKEVLSSQAIWICASCYHCTVRCPRGVKITDTMAMLRNLAIVKGHKPNKGMVFNKAFMEIIKRYGRMFEPELMLRYNLATNPLTLLGKASLGLAMLRKGKIGFKPEKMEDRKELKNIFATVEKGRR